MGNKQFFCDELNNVLSCFHDRIMSCCSGQMGPIYIENYHGEQINWEQFKQFKTDSFALLNENDIEKSPCNNCFFLREKNENDKISPQYKTLNISHWVHCNCGCIYCARMQSSHGKITEKPAKSDYYDMLPLLKQLYKQNLLDRDNLTVSIQGGDISVLKEFEPMVKEFLKSGVNNLEILSNNIKYQPIIKKLLDLNKASFCTSLDCANRETYKTLKRVDKFDDSVKNLQKYAKSKHPERITVKYILVENINDNIQEAEKFINLMSDIGIINIEFMIDNKYVIHTDLDAKPMPKQYKDIYFLFKEKCEQKNINLVMWSKVEYIINKYLLNIT